MRYVLLIAVFLTGCVEQGPRAVYVPDPMEALCDTTDFSHHTDKELHDCGVWLAPRAARYQGFQPRPRPRDPEPTTYSIYSNTGKLQSLLSCSGTTCTEVPH
jgi:hypothetical protein